MRCSEIINILEELAPHRMACEWDNPGLLAGRKEKEVKKLLLCVDADDEAAALAVRQGADMIISHHPLIFRSIKRVTDEDFIGRRLVEMIQSDLSYFAMHTNFDSAPGCMAAQLMRSVGQAHLGLIVSIISFVVNIGANYIFIFGKFGMPRMEIAGAALGTLIARGAEFITTFFYILVKDKSLGLRICHLIKSPSAAFYRSYFRLGAPVLVSDSLLGLGGNIVSVVLGHMGAAVVASNAICQVVDRLCTVVIQGVSNASGIITGQTLGTGNRKKAMEQGETFYFFSIVFGLLSSLLVFLFGPLTVSVYTLNQETVVLVHQMMNAYVVIVFFQAIQSVMTKGVLRGGGDTKFLMKADILFMWLVSIPLGAVGGLVLHWPAWLVMLCLRADYVIKSVWCVSRLLSGKWIHMADGISEKV